MTTESASLDRNAYFSRIAYCGPTAADLETLRALHERHTTSIPFENLDILLGRPIRLDLEALEQKLIDNGRGGYCFEQNLLFAAVLESLGFSVTRLAARVRFGATRLLPRTHMVLKVDLEGSSWLADVGFGGEGLLHPIELVPEQENSQHAWTYRLVREAELWVLQSLHADGWFDLYAFDLVPQFQVDYEVANWYVSTHPDSIFRRTMTVQRTTPEARFVLRFHELTVDRGPGKTTSRTIDDDELLDVLADPFGLSFPAGTRFVVAGHPER